MTVAQLASDMHLPTEVKVARGYEWFAPTNFDRALSWADSLQTTSDIQTKTYLTNALVDLVHYDRASRGASVLLKPPQPIREKDLEVSIYKGAGASWIGDNGWYTLQRKPLVWGADAPFDAVDATACVAAASQPDKFWIGEYVRDKRKWDPIIYAEYGAWLLEVARWDED